ncbi:PIG-L deacetylase family protein [Kitasatospora sp. NPDC101155]|uniref:PIG-L deacetylase family protein n=1 Tax=Kitasatospora sp. NPDC101155 TaxID=3364097 RepID=UPI0037FC4777
MTGAVPGSVLAAFAHPDDAELWAGATLALHARSAAVTIAVPHRDKIRDAEARKGAAPLGADLHQVPRLDHATVQQLLLETQPEIVITHPLNDVHPEHRAVATTVLAAVPEPRIATGRPSRFYTCDTYNFLALNGPVRADAIVDATATFDTKTVNDMPPTGLFCLRAPGWTPARLIASRGSRSVPLTDVSPQRSCSGDPSSARSERPPPVRPGRCRPR